MNLGRTFAAVSASAALSLASLAVMGGTATAAADGAYTPAQKDALLRLLDADTVQEARAIATTDAVPDGFAGAVLDTLEPLKASQELGAESIAEGAYSPDELVRSALRRVIDPQQYQCTRTDLDDIVDDALLGPWAGFSPVGATKEEIQEWSDAVGPVYALAIAGGLNGPTYDVLLNADDARFSKFGYGSMNQTTDITGTFQDLKHFWDINGRSIRLEPMKSTIVFSGKAADITRFGKAAMASQAPDKIPAQDTPNHIAVYSAYGQGMVDLVHSVPWLDDPSNPIFTLNAFAMDPTDEPAVFGKFGKLLVYGDGLLDAQQEMGLLDAGPESVMGHEYGHHVQYVNKDIQTGTLTPEGTRQSELMADAYGSYFATHTSGMNFKNRTLSQVIESFEQVGDCNFEAVGHHGTPQQRQRAAIWGSDLAVDAACVNGKPQVKGVCKSGQVIIASKTLRNQFNKALPELIAPDA